MRDREVMIAENMPPIFRLYLTLQPYPCGQSAAMPWKRSEKPVALPCHGYCRVGCQLYWRYSSGPIAVTKAGVESQQSTDAWAYEAPGSKSAPRIWKKPTRGT